MSDHRYADVHSSFMHGVYPGTPQGAANMPLGLMGQSIQVPPPTAPTETRHDYNIEFDPQYEENPAVLLIDSADRNHDRHPYPNYYRVKVNKPYHKVSSVDLSRADIPASGYIINQYNNILNLVDNSVSYTITIDPGNYNITELTAEITTVINGTSGVTGTYDVSVNSITSKITITRAGGTGTVELVFSGGQKKYGDQDVDVADFDQSTTITYGDREYVYSTNSIGKVIGFKPQNYTGATSYTGQHTYNLKPAQYMILKVNASSDRSFGRVDSLNDNADGAFAVIFLESQVNSFQRMICTDIDDEACRVVFNPPIEKLDRFEIEILDSNGKRYDFNGHDHVLSFEINSMSRQGKFRYKEHKNTITKSHKKVRSRKKS